MTYFVKGGTTSYRDYWFRVLDATTFLPYTGATSATAGASFGYQRPGSTLTAISLSDLAATNSAYSSGGIKHIAAGWYRLDIPDAAIAAGVGNVLIEGAFTSYVVITPRIQITGADISTDVVATVAGSLDVNAKQWAGTAVAAPTTAGVPRVDVKAMEAGVITAASIAADAITDAKVAADVTIASVTGAVGSVTGAVGSVTGNVGGNVVGSVGSVATGGITAASIAADAIGASELATDACQKIADVALRRTMASIEASSNGETLSVESLYGLIAVAFEAALASTTLTVRKSDGSTLGTKTLTLDSGATPVVGIT